MTSSFLSIARLFIAIIPTITSVFLAFTSSFLAITSSFLATFTASSFLATYPANSFLLSIATVGMVFVYPSPETLSSSGMLGSPFRRRSHCIYRRQQPRMFGSFFSRTSLA
jgi:hypothetical protein